MKGLPFMQRIFSSRLPLWRAAWLVRMEKIQEWESFVNPYQAFSIKHLESADLGKVKK